MDLRILGQEFGNGIVYAVDDALWSAQKIEQVLLDPGPDNISLVPPNLASLNLASANSSYPANSYRSRRSRSRKILKPKKTKHALANDTVDQAVQAWSLKCDPCYAASKNNIAKLNKSTTPTLDSWVSEVGCSTSKRNKWAAHREIMRIAPS